MVNELFEFDVKAPEYVIFKPTDLVQSDGSNLFNFSPIFPVNNNQHIEIVDYSQNDDNRIIDYSKYKISKNKQEFLNKLDIALAYTPQYNTEKWKTWLTKLAERESSFREHIVNKNSGAYGYFQLMSFNRNSDNQFNDMFKLMTQNIKDLKRLLKEKELNKAKELGINDFGLLAGAHLGGVGGVLKVLRSEGNPKDSNGTSVLQYMKEFSI